MKTMTSDTYQNNNNVDDKTSLLSKIYQIFNYGLNKLYIVYKENRRNILIIVSMSVFTLLMVCIFNDKKSANTLIAMEHKNAASIFNKLQEIDSQLNQLVTTQYTPEKLKTNILNISTEIASLKGILTNTVNKVDIQNVSNQIISARDELNTNILDIKKTIIDSSQSKQYVNIKSLPFKVVSIDVISEKPFVSVEYENHLTPLMIGDSVAGWSIVSASYETATVELKNVKDQYIKLSLKD